MKDGNWIKSYVIQVIPVLALLVYIMGFAYYMVYYDQFGINIVSYITLSEVLILTLVPILTVVLISIFLGVVQFFTMPSFSAVDRECVNLKKRIKTTGFAIAVEKSMSKIIIGHRKYVKAEKEESKKPRKQLFFMTTMGFTIAIILIIIPCCIYIGVIDVRYKYLFTFGLLISGNVFISSYIKRYRLIKHKLIKIYSNINSMIILFMSILICTVFLAVYNSDQDKTDDNLKFCITVQDNSEYTDKDYIYIGECSKSIFLYNKKDKSTLALNTANLVGVAYYNKKENVYTKLIDDFILFGKEHP